MRRYFSLRYKITTLVIIILLGGILFNTLISTLLFQRYYSEAVKNEIFALGKNLKSTLESGLVNLGLKFGQLAGFDEECHLLIRQNPQLIYVFVSDLQGKIIYAHKPAFQGIVFQSPVDRKASSSLVNLMQPHYFQGMAVYDFSLPIFDAKRDHVGVIRIGLPVSVIKEKITRTIGVSCLFGIFISLFTLLILIILLNIWVQRPLVRIMKKMRGFFKTPEGLAKKPQIIARDEIEELDKVFDKMIKDLQETTVSRTYLDNIINSMMNSLIVLDNEGKITKVNKATLELLDYTEQDLIGQPLRIVLREEADKVLKEIIKDSWIRNTEKSYFTKTGVAIPVLFSASLITDTEGKTQGIVCVAQDITERKEAEEELSRAYVKLKQIQDELMRLKGK